MDGSSVASSGAVVCRATTWMYVCGEWGFMLGMEAPLSTGSTVSIDTVDQGIGATVCTKIRCHRPWS